MVTSARGSIEVRTVAGYREGLERHHHVVIAFHVEVIGGDLCARDDATECGFFDPRALPTPLTPALEDVFRDARLL